MLCSNCGKPLTENASFCENCGAPVPVVQMQDSNETETFGYMFANSTHIMQIQKKNEEKFVSIGEFEEMERKLSEAYSKLEKSNHTKNILVGCVVFLVASLCTLFSFIGFNF